MDIIERVRQSCHRAVDEGFLQSVTIMDDNLSAFYTKHHIDSENFNGTPEKLQTPLKFTSINEQINFYVLYGFMQFGSGWRHLLHKHGGRGAADTIVYGLLSMVISGRNLDAETLASLTLNDIADYFAIAIKMEKPVSHQGVITQVVDSELKPFAQLLQRELNYAGKKLWERQCKDFAQFVREGIDEANRNHKPVVASLVDDLVTTFSDSLDDKITLVHPETKEELVVYLYKKAQLIVSTLYNNLREIEPEVFDFPQEQISNLTSFVDNVLPAVLVKDGVLKLDEDLYQRIQSDKAILPKGREEGEMRTAALVALERISQLSNGRVTPEHLDYLLWAKIGKKPEYRQFERHYVRDTVFY